MTAVFDASVVILTCDRLAMLRRLVMALEFQTPKPKEVLVVDNGSQDGTRDWLEHEAPGAIRWIKGSETLDFAAARNRAIPEARGEWVVFIDDDCVPATGWLGRLAAQAEETDAVGGPVIALRELPHPEWFDPEMGWAIGLSTPGAFTEAGGKTVLPQTANLAVRREILLAFPFQEMPGAALRDGPLARYDAGREDAAFWRRLRIEGRRCQWDAAFVVFHDIDPARLTEDYIRERMTRDARAAVARSQPPRYIEGALADVATGWIPGAARAPRDRMWRARQMEYLRACRQAGDPGLVGLNWPRRLAGAWRDQMSAWTKRSIRQTSVGQRARRELPAPDKIHNIMVAAYGFLGDMTILAPVLQWARTGLSQGGRLLLLTGPRTRELYEGLELADAIVTVDNRETYLKDHYLLRELPVHLTIIPYWHSEYASLPFATSAPTLSFDADVGFPRQWQYDRLDHRIRKDMSAPELVNLCRLFGPLGLEGPPPAIEWPRPAEARDRVDALFQKEGIDSDRILIGVHADATHPNKAWPSERWAQWGRRLTEAHPDARLVFVGAGAGRPAASDLIEAIGATDAVNLCGRDDLRTFPEIARRLGILVTTDSGPKHLAAAVGCPTVCIYGWTDPARWAPYDAAHRHRSVVAGDPLMTDEEMFGQPGLAIRRVTVDMVETAVEDIWAAEGLERGC